MGWFETAQCVPGSRYPLSCCANVCWVVVTTDLNIVGLSVWITSIFTLNIDCVVDRYRGRKRQNQFLNMMLPDYNATLFLYHLVQIILLQIWWWLQLPLLDMFWLQFFLLEDVPNIGQYSADATMGPFLNQWFLKKGLFNTRNFSFVVNF